MERLNRNLFTDDKELDIKVIQFGEGNFLRAFVDYAFYVLNKECDTRTGIAVVQPIEHGLINLLNEQDGLYTLFMKGYVDRKIIEEKHLINNIVKGIDPYKDFESFMELSRIPTLEFIISNTTEAGITFDDADRMTMKPPRSFPAKLTMLLYERYQHFNGDGEKGVAIIPCELINYNADTLKSIILKYASLWNLEEGFVQWIEKNNTFHNTLVDRIVPGYPRDELDNYLKELDYDDKLIVTAEFFFLWVIEGDDELKNKLPFYKTSLDVKIVQDMQPFRTRKVRILNGAHTAMVPFGLLYGNETVKQTIDNEFTGNFVKQLLYDEIIPTLNLDKDELKQFADDTLDRFRNPFIRHQLSSIALNSISKFKVRVLPSLIKYYEIYQELPLHMTFSFACLLRFYQGEWGGEKLPLNDDQDIIDYFKSEWESDDLNGMVKRILSNSDLWGCDLTGFTCIVNTITKALEEIQVNGIEAGFNNFKKSFS